jgi:hypothetical protein
MLLLVFIQKSGNTIIEGYGLDGESQITVPRCGPVLEVARQQNGRQGATSPKGLPF